MSAMSEYSIRITYITDLVCEIKWLTVDCLDKVSPRIQNIMSCVMETTAVQQAVEQ